MFQLPSEDTSRYLPYVEKGIIDSWNGLGWQGPFEAI